MSEWLPDSKPSWWSQAASFFDNPVSTVRDWVSGAWLRRQIAGIIVGGLISFYLGALAYLRAVFVIMRGAVVDVQQALSNALEALFAPLLDIVTILQELFISVTVAAGPFAFLVGFVVFAFAGIALSVVASTLIRVIPFL